MQNAYTIVNSQNGHLAFKLSFFDNNVSFDHLQRNNYYSIIWLKAGTGKLKADFSEYGFAQNTLFAFSPYQPFMFLPDQDVEGIALQFHPDFFCIHRHQAEVACNGILFNNIYQPPFISIGDDSSGSLDILIEQIKTEIQNPALAQYELLVSYLKIFLITASRLKTTQHPEFIRGSQGSNPPFILQSLKDAIEKDFKTKHSPGEYASGLNISARALAKLTKLYFNKTLTALISERIIIEAKRELYLTDKAVKEIAYELGYEDEYYFSRFFKINADISPQLYRETVGFGRGAVK